MPISLRPAGKARKIAYAILGTPSGKKSKVVPNKIEMSLGTYVDRKIK